MKVARENYTENRFFYTETFEGAPRTIIWDNTPEGQKNIFKRLIADMEDRLEYLLKEDTFKEAAPHEYQRWTRVSGGIYKNDFIELLTEFEDWFFSDSGFQFCLREPDKSDYFAYDEHGLFFLYDKQYFENVFKNMGFVCEKKELITDKPHWAGRPKDAEETLKEFKLHLKEKSVFFEDEAEK